MLNRLWSHAIFALICLSVVGGAEAVDRVLTGALEATNPVWNRLSDRSGYPDSANDSLPYQVIELKSETGGTLIATMNSTTQFDSFLALYASFNPASPSANIFTADDDGGGYPHARIIKANLAANVSYYLVISSYSGSANSVYPLYGSYSVTLSGAFMDVPIDLPNVGSTRRGTLTATDSVWNRISNRSGYPDSANDGLPYDLLEIKSPTGGTLTATVENSTQFDSFLALYPSFNPASPGSNILAADDDGGGYPHAQITKTGIAANTKYYLVVSSYSGPANAVYPLYGSYSVNLSGDFVFVSGVTGGLVNVKSITRSASSPTNAGSVSWTVTLTGPVDQLSLGNFRLWNAGLGGSPALTHIAGAGKTWTVTASTGSGDGTLRLNMANSRGSVPPVFGLPFKGETYTIDRTSPAVTIGPPSQTMTSKGPVNYLVTYSGASSSSLSNADVTLTRTGPANGTVGVSQEGDMSYIVTISDITGEGILGISIASGTAKDRAGNLAPTAGPGAAVIVDNTAPQTTATPAGGIKTSSQSVTLFCDDGIGSGCSDTYYCFGPSCSTYRKYTAPLTIGSTKVLNFYSTDRAGNKGTVKTETYNISKPAAPVGVTAAYTPGVGIALKWTDSSDNETGFRIYRKKGSETTWTVTGEVGEGTTAYSDSGIEQYCTYRYKVSAFNGVGSSDSAIAAVGTGSLEPPSILSIKMTDADTEANIIWLDNSGFGTGFNVYRRDSSATNWARLTPLPLAPDISAYRDSWLLPGILYLYRVCTVSGSGGGFCSFSQMVNGPAGLNAAESPSGVELSWTDNSSDESGFGVWRRTSTETAFAQLGIVAADVEAYSDSTTEADTTYYYKVSAFNGIGSVYSSQSMITTGTVNPPYGLMAAASGATSQLSWKNDAEGAGLEIWRLGGGQTGWTLLTNSPLAPDVSTYSDTIDAGKLYMYQVCSKSVSGGSACSKKAGINGPCGLSATPVGGAVDLGWTDISLDEDGFNIWRKESAGANWELIGKTGENSNTYSDTMVMSGDYNYKICAHNGVVAGLCTHVTVTIP